MFNNNSFNRNQINTGNKMKKQYIQPGCNHPRRTPDTVNQVSHIPGEQDVAYSNHFGVIKLVAKIGSGGEGTVYSTNTQYVAKIFHARSNTTHKIAKLMRLMSKPLTCEGICAPLDIIYNASHEPMGYLMKMAEGQPLTCLSVPQIFQSKFPCWKKRDLVQTGITIMKMFNYLHNRDILMGDVNPDNILVKSPTEVYFTDVDSYQIEDLPCTVGRPEFTPPELSKFDDFHDFLRNPGNENFSIAILLFYLMIPGQHPYRLSNGLAIKENMRNKTFPYPLGPNKGFAIPDGPWRYMWSHLPANPKKAFYHTFVNNGAFTKMSERLYANDWKHILEQYLELLDSGKLVAQDPMSEDIYPTRFKKQPGTILVYCQRCHNEVDEKYCDQGVCMDCRRRENFATGKPMAKSPILRASHPAARSFANRKQPSRRKVSDRLSKLNY